MLHQAACSRLSCTNTEFLTVESSTATSVSFLLFIATSSFRDTEGFEFFTGIGFDAVAVSFAVIFDFGTGCFFIVVFPTKFGEEVDDLVFIETDVIEVDGGDLTHCVRWVDVVDGGEDAGTEEVFEFGVFGNADGFGFDVEGWFFRKVKVKEGVGEEETFFKGWIGITVNGITVFKKFSFG